MYPGELARTLADRAAIVLVESGRSLSFGEFDANANRVAQLLRGEGLRRGDHVAMLMENHLRYFETMAGAERCGLYYTAINSHLTAEEVAYILDDCDAAVLFTSNAKLDIAAAAIRLLTADGRARVRRLLCVDLDEESAGFEPYDAAIAAHPSTPISDEQLGAAMLYSSGTTGRPKGILRPLPDAHPGESLPVMAFASQVLFRMHGDMTYLSPAPIYHSAPQASVSSALRLGATSLVMERFDAERFLATVEEHRVTHTQLVPTMFSRLVKLPDDIRERYDLSSLENVIHAAAPCPVQVKQAMIDWLGPIVNEYYGATEGNGFTFCTSTEWLAHPGTVGRAVLGAVRILDDDGGDVATGETGTVWFEGATNFVYYNDPDKTAEGRDETGTRSTVGDVGHVDDEGYLYLTDRKSYMIISGGVNIYPQECEDLLITHPKVFDAAVIGVPNEDLGEEVKAIVQLMPGVEAGGEAAQELIEFCSEHLARYKVPRSVDFEDDLPRLPTGKLYKRLLRDRFWDTDQSRIAH